MNTSRFISFALLSRFSMRYVSAEIRKQTRCSDSYSHNARGMLLWNTTLKPHVSAHHDRYDGSYLIFEDVVQLDRNKKKWAIKKLFELFLGLLSRLFSSGWRTWFAINTQGPLQNLKSEPWLESETSSRRSTFSTVLIWSENRAIICLGIEWVSTERKHGHTNHYRVYLYFTSHHVRRWIVTRRKCTRFVRKFTYLSCWFNFNHMPRNELLIDLNARALLFYWWLRRRYLHSRCFIADGRSDGHTLLSQPSWAL